MTVGQLTEVLKGLQSDIPVVLATSPHEKGPLKVVSVSRPHELVYNRVGDVLGGVPPQVHYGLIELELRSYR